MKKNLFFGTLLFGTWVFIFASSGAFSSPPVEERYDTFKQTDGTEIVLARYGDAWFHWLETRAGEVVVKNPETGDYEYATIKKEKGRRVLAPSGLKVDTDTTKLEDKAATMDKKNFVPVTRKDLIPLRKAALKYKKAKPQDNIR